MLDVAHPSAGYLKLPLLPGIGTFGDKIDEDHPYGFHGLSRYQFLNNNHSEILSELGE
jgi:hypothetical protein